MTLHVTQTYFHIFPSSLPYSEPHTCIFFLFFFLAYHVIKVMTTRLQLHSTDDQKEKEKGGKRRSAEKAAVATGAKQTLYEAQQSS